MKIKSTRIINLNNSIFTETYSKRYQVLFLIMMVSGIVCGVVIQVLNESVNKEVLQNFNEFIDINVSKSFFELLCGNFLYNLLYILLPLFFGVSAVGYIFIFFVPLIKGLGIGTTCALIYSMFGIKGIGYCAILIYPIAVIQLLVIILSCNESYQMSSDIFSVLRKSNTAEEIKINLFFLRYLIITLILLLSSIVYALCNLLFFKIIS